MEHPLVLSSNLLASPPLIDLSLSFLPFSLSLSLSPPSLSFSKIDRECVSARLLVGQLLIKSHKVHV